MSVEIVGLLVYVVILLSVLRIQSNGVILSEMKYQKEYPNCNFEHRIWKLILIPQLMRFQNIAFYIIFLCPDIHSHQISSS